MKSYEFLSDERRNPEQNPKVSPNQAIKKYSYEDDYEKIFVSFTSVPKLGINPQSKYNTPIGIYAYPIKYVYGETGDRGKMSNLPFAGDAPYVNIFKSTGNILTISSMKNDNTLMAYYEELRRVMSPFEKGEMRGGYMHYEDFVDNFARNSETEAKVDTPGGHFWYVTMKCAEVVSKKKGIAKPLAWNWLFRQLGIDGVVDEGEGIIHENEPTQAVFFSMDNVELLERVDNKYNPEQMTDQRYKGQHLRKQFEKAMSELRPILQSGSVGDLIEWLDWGTNHTNMRYVPAKLRPQVLSQRPYYINALKEPSKNDLYASFTTSPGLMSDYGNRLLKLLTVDDIVNILRKFNDRMDVSDPTRARTVMAQQLKYIMSDVGEQGRRMDFITELTRARPYLWDYIEDQYIPYASGMREEYRELVYKIAKAQGSHSVIDSLKRAGAFTVPK